ncbi:MAG: TauD/TfdA dioxygenase family protein, partial [Bradyrhizobium sp.]
MLLQIEKLHPLFGAEVGNVDLSKPIDQAGIDAIQAALDKYAVLIFHGPKLTEEAQISFAERFGPLEGQNGVLATNVARVSRKLVDISNLDEKNDVLGVQDRRRMFALGNQLWHTDS